METFIHRVLTWLGLRPHNRPMMPIEDGGELWYTVNEAAALLNVSRQRVHQYIDDGRLVTKPLGRLVVISRTSILQMPHRPTGRPRKS